MRERNMSEENAKAAIERFGTVQRKVHFTCPRCGEDSMDEDPVRNALSRHAKCYVCDACGTDEAMRDFVGVPMPLSEWSIIKNVYNVLNGDDCE